jgi:hypothetical protein
LFLFFVETIEQKPFCLSFAFSFSYTTLSVLSPKKTKQNKTKTNKSLDLPTKSQSKLMFFSSKLKQMEVSSLLSSDPKPWNSQHYSSDVYSMVQDWSQLPQFRPQAPLSGHSSTSRPEFHFLSFQDIQELLFLHLRRPHSQDPTATIPLSTTLPPTSSVSSNDFSPASTLLALSRSTSPSSSPPSATVSLSSLFPYPSETQSRKRKVQLNNEDEKRKATRTCLPSQDPSSCSCPWSSSSSTSSTSSTSSFSPYSSSEVEREAYLNLLQSATADARRKRGIMSKSQREAAFKALLEECQVFDSVNDTSCQWYLLRPNSNDPPRETDLLLFEELRREGILKVIALEPEQERITGGKLFCLTRDISKLADFWKGSGAGRNANHKQSVSSAFSRGFSRCNPNSLPFFP